MNYLPKRSRIAADEPEGLDLGGLNLGGGDDAPSEKKETTQTPEEQGGFINTLVDKLKEIVTNLFVKVIKSETIQKTVQQLLSKDGWKVEDSLVKSSDRSRFLKQATFLSFYRYAQVEGFNKACSEAKVSFLLNTINYLTRLSAENQDALKNLKDIIEKSEKGESLSADELLFLDRLNIKQEKLTELKEKYLKLNKNSITQNVSRARKALNHFAPSGPLQNFFRTLLKQGEVKVSDLEDILKDVVPLPTIEKGKLVQLKGLKTSPSAISSLPKRVPFGKEQISPELPKDLLTEFDSQLNNLKKQSLDSYTTKAQAFIKLFDPVVHKLIKVEPIQKEWQNLKALWEQIETLQAEESKPKTEERLKIITSEKETLLKAFENFINSFKNSQLRPYKKFYQTLSQQYQAQKPLYDPIKQQTLKPEVVISEVDLEPLKKNPNYHLTEVTKLFTNFLEKWLNWFSQLTRPDIRMMLYPEETLIDTDDLTELINQREYLEKTHYKLIDQSNLNRHWYQIKSLYEELEQLVKDYYEQRVEVARQQQDDEVLAKYRSQFGLSGEHLFKSLQLEDLSDFALVMKNIRALFMIFDAITRIAEKKKYVLPKPTQITKAEDFNDLLKQEDVEAPIVPKIDSVKSVQKTEAPDEDVEI